MGEGHHLRAADQPPQVRPTDHSAAAVDEVAKARDGPGTGILTHHLHLLAEGTTASRTIPSTIPVNSDRKKGAVGRRVVAVLQPQCC